MTEEDFIRLVDCRFPYLDRESSLLLMQEAAKISPNAQFMVLSEILRLPGSMQVPVAVQHELVFEWQKAAGSETFSAFATIAVTKLDTIPDSNLARKLVDIASDLPPSECMFGLLEWFCDGVLSEEMVEEIVTGLRLDASK